jgi:hypothetical protein
LAHLQQLEAEDKVLLLADLVVKFGDPSCDAALKEFIPVLETTIETIKTKLPKQPVGDVQLLAVSVAHYTNVYFFNCVMKYCGVCCCSVMNVK